MISEVAEQVINIWFHPELKSEQFENKFFRRLSSRDEMENVEEACGFYPKGF